MKVDFYLRFHTQFGQLLAITGNLPALGNNEADKALRMSFLSDELWQASVEIDPSELDILQYRYIFINEKGESTKEAEKERIVDIKKLTRDLLLVDTWNDASFFENSFYSAPFHEVFFKDQKKLKLKKNSLYTHQFKVKAPLLNDNEVVCLLGSSDALGHWNTDTPILLSKKGNWWSVQLEIPASEFAMSYKYGIYNLKKSEFFQFEIGDNRVLHNDGSVNKKTIIHDGFVKLHVNKWKGSGVAIPVFSLRTNNSFGIGEFNDIKLLVDWANEVRLKMIQILPINDTSATHTWKDSYPYAAISAFALHPIYVNLQKVASKKGSHIIKALTKKQKQLNQLAEIDYEQVINFKTNVLRELFELDNLDFLKEDSFKEFFEDNQNWLVPYAAFCYLRDKYNTSDFSKWKTHSIYNEAEIERLCNPKSKTFTQIAFHLFVQYHLHLQLKDSVDYAHKRGIALKGDIPIGIYRYGCDAWTAPELYQMNMQAGAPPDDFAVKGQNWGFPTYNWKKMEEDHFDWWKQRFHQMSNYFDAFRIDHILGFFRIWSIPTDAVEGILGRFIPALPIHANEFGERGIWFEYDRYCKPFIVDGIVHQTFNSHSEFVKEHFLQRNSKGGYDLKEEFNTQRKVEEYFSKQDENDENDKIKNGLYDLISNVILFEEPNSNKQQFHFRISIDQTSSYHYFDNATKAKIWDLYINYFYRRQDEFWKKEALKKLPALKDATEMLICGEDLGMVPHSVPEVMQALGILSLEIQRMPKNPNIEFFHPKDAPYLSVVTPSSHDMSTIRGWWEEDREKTQRFFNTILSEGGPAPYFCEPWLNRAIILQHLYSPAMWSIFQLQDLLGMSETLRRQDPHEERINVPANSNHYWNYRIHLGLEQLIKEKEFNQELRDYITNSGRS
ncbi:MAG TPA: 4-alpha-glucanotransferase [Flavisolibacter sp.]|jgi:4-alpha-glucanotransferase|nr:4-alpha-glucanotransferase [Flavisolibacter sp.]